MWYYKRAAFKSAVDAVCFGSVLFPAYLWLMAVGPANRKYSMLIYRLGCLGSVQSLVPKPYIELPCRII
jgi:hypothetical protein